MSGIDEPTDVCRHDLCVRPGVHAAHDQDFVFDELPNPCTHKRCKIVGVHPAHPEDFLRKHETLSSAERSQVKRYAPNMIAIVVCPFCRGGGCKTCGRSGELREIDRVRLHTFDGPRRGRPLKSRKKPKARGRS